MGRKKTMRRHIVILIQELNYIFTSKQPKLDTLAVLCMCSGSSTVNADAKKLCTSFQMAKSIVLVLIFHFIYCVTISEDSFAAIYCASTYTTLN